MAIFSGGKEYGINKRKNTLIALASPKFNNDTNQINESIVKLEAFSHTKC